MKSYIYYQIQTLLINALKIITDINFKRFKNYIILNDIIKRSKKSKKAANFIGTNDLEFQK